MVIKILTTHPDWCGYIKSVQPSKNKIETTPDRREAKTYLTN